MKQQIDLAIIIPTLNEEYYIGDLLDSIASQTVSPKEVVVVDAFSQDKTAEEVKKRQKDLPGLKFYQIPKFTISRQRNFGVTKTKADHLLFLDADMYLKDPNTLKKYMEEIETRNPDIAAAINLPNSEEWKDRAFFVLEHSLYMVTSLIWPMTTTKNLYVKRQMFEKVRGFDERVAVGEDFEFVGRVTKKKGKFIFLNKAKVYTSVRRLQKEGRIRFALKMTKSFFYVVTHGYHNNPVEVEYEFGKFSNRE